MRLQGIGYTDQGQVRSNNEDAYWVDNDLGIFIVCDGMGGQAAGDVASQSVVEILRETLDTQKDVLLSLDPQDASTPATLQDIAREAVEKANHGIYTMAKENLGMGGMGTTLLLLLTCGSHAVTAHVGDSRLYLHRNSKVFQLSTDHTLVQEFLNRGYLTKEQAIGHPHSNVLVRAVGQSASIEADFLYCEVLPGDTLVLCSDGLSRYFEESQTLSDFCVEPDIQQLPQKLTEWANEQGGRDNITVVAIRPVSQVEVKDTLEIPAKAESEFYHALDVLKTSPLTDNLSLQGQMRLLNRMDSMTYEDGATLFSPGDEVHGLVLVQKGTLERSVSGSVVETLTPGMDLYPMALLDPVINIDTISVSGPTTLLYLSSEKFQRTIRRKPWLGHRLMKNLARTLGNRLLASETSLHHQERNTDEDV